MKEEGPAIDLGYRGREAILGCPVAVDPIVALVLVLAPFHIHLTQDIRAARAEAVLTVATEVEAGMTLETAGLDHQLATYKPNC